MEILGIAIEQTDDEVPVTGVGSQCQNEFIGLLNSEI
jgi:hypothetical protein